MTDTDLTDLTTLSEADLLYFVQLIVSRPGDKLTREDRRELARIAREFRRREQAGKRERRRGRDQVARLEKKLRQAVTVIRRQGRQDGLPG